MKRLGVVGRVLVVALSALFVRVRIVESEEPLVIVTHWSNSHPMRDGLLPEMATEFNDADHETRPAGRSRSTWSLCDSSVQVDDLVSRVKGAGR